MVLCRVKCSFACVLRFESISALHLVMSGRSETEVEYSVGFDANGIISALDCKAWCLAGAFMDLAWNDLYGVMTGLDQVSLFYIFFFFFFFLYFYTFSSTFSSCSTIFSLLVLHCLLLLLLNFLLVHFFLLLKTLLLWLAWLGLIFAFCSLPAS